MLPGKKFAIDDIFKILRRRVWLLVVPPILALFVALLVSATLPNLYQSEMLIAIVPQRVPDTFVRSTVTLRTEERLDAITSQITSRTVIEQMINEFDLYDEERGQLPMEDVVQIMRDSIEVVLESSPGAGPRTGAAARVHVRFTYRDPNIAARVTQRLGSTLRRSERARSRRAGASHRRVPERCSSTEARARLEAQEKRVEAFREQHGNELPTQLQSNMQASRTRTCRSRRWSKRLPATAIGS